MIGFLRSKKLAIALIAYLLIFLAIASLAGQGLSAGNALRSLLFIVPLILFTLNLGFCTAYRLYLEYSGQRAWRPGPDLIHVALLFFILAASLSLFARWEGEVSLAIGNLVRLDENHLLKLEDFSIQRYDNGAVSQYVSRVSLLSGEGELLRRGMVSVNHPLRVGSYRIYQSGWQQEGEKKLTILMAVRDPGSLPAAIGALLLLLGVVMTYLSKLLVRKERNNG